MARAAKTKMICVVQGFYSGRWEDLTAATTRQECRADYRAYRDNEAGAFRIINRRVDAVTMEPVKRSRR